MKGIIVSLLVAALPAMAAVSGTVINRSTEKPQAGATVALFKLGQQNGLEQVDQAKSDQQGKFTISHEVQGPYLVRTAFDGVTYNHMLPPGSATTGLTIEVYNASRQAGAARVAKHMILFEPGPEQMSINETFLYTNDGRTAWNDPDRGTLQFHLPPAAQGKVQVSATAPGGLPIAAAVVKTARPDVHAVDFAIKPGETRFDLIYTVPYKEGAAYEGRIVTKDENSYLIAPAGVTLAGEGLTDLGLEPRTQAHIYGLTGAAYKISLTGVTAAASAQPPAAEAAEQQDSGPQIEQIMPRIYGNAKVILGLALGILALGFAILYRAPGVEKTKEANGRGRR